MASDRFLPLAAGVAPNFAANRMFKCRNTTVKPLEQSSTFVTDGVFRYTRNPKYLGVVVIGVKIAALEGSASPSVAAALLIIAFDWLFIEREEAMLENSFGYVFRAYRSRFPRCM